MLRKNLKSIESQRIFDSKSFHFKLFYLSSMGSLKAVFLIGIEPLKFFYIYFQIRGDGPTFISRAFSLFCLAMLWQMVELNTFFSKHFFVYPGSHFCCWGRILFMGLISCPAIRQYYSYATDSRCKRLGNHAWG